MYTCKRYTIYMPLNVPITGAVRTSTACWGSPGTCTVPVRGWRLAAGWELGAVELGTAGPIASLLGLRGMWG